MYPANIARCQHLKINGTQRGSPALRNERYCYFHRESSQTLIPGDDKPRIRQRVRPRPVHVQLLLLEDANSIQVALMQVMRLLLNGEVEHRTAALLLYGLQTASANLIHTSFEPAKAGGPDLHRHRERTADSLFKTGLRPFSRREPAIRLRSRNVFAGITYLS